MALEYCFLCGEQTGRAGRADDSIYCECGAGPFCLECWHGHSCEWKDNVEPVEPSGNS